MGIPCRCGNRIRGKTCFTRRTLAKRPEKYSATRYQPPCPSCGARKWMVDKWRIKHEVWGHGDTCYCGGYHFQHRKGSRYCDSNPNAEQHWAVRLGRV